MAIIASDERRSFSIRFLLHVLIFFSEAKDHFTDALVTGTVSTSWSNSVTSELWYKKLRSCYLFISNQQMRI